jgi:hypothetical protein
MSDPTPISRVVKPTHAQIAAMRRGELNATLNGNAVVEATLSGKPILPALADALLRQASLDLGVSS